MTNDQRRLRTRVAVFACIAVVALVLDQISMTIHSAKPVLDPLCGIAHNRDKISYILRHLYRPQGLLADRRQMLVFCGNTVQVLTPPAAENNAQSNT